uniref:Transcriptional regulator, LacI family n=1 Tax=uncultured Nocardioidaceae bacterium TaxID=253824 RepID=A0A6J4KV63_9ACTN|nr:MAG: Transcriptional regulator, LacI family [uncultured Nocardioidaceae bacterium]
MKALSSGPPAVDGLTAQVPGSAPSGSEPTIYAVAEQANVSISTVSRVLRGSAPVNPATRERVLTAVAQLGYTPSRSARSLAEGRHAAHGILFPGLSGPYFAEVVLGYEEVAAELGRSVLVVCTHGRAAIRDKAVDLASRVDGMVVLGRAVGDEVIADLLSRRLPLVLLGHDPVEAADSINAENTDSAYALAMHLVGDHGYRSLAFLGDTRGSFDTSQRWEGFRRALLEAGVPVSAPTPCPLDEDGGRHAAEQLLRENPPRALACANDEIALGAIGAAERLGLRVPEDLAITGWDDVMAARHSRPGLTTVRQPMRELGSMAARWLHERLSTNSLAPRHEVLPTQLVIRASCGNHSEEDQ